MAKLREPGPFSHWVFKNRVVWFAVLFVAAVALDQGTKVAVQSTLAVEREYPVKHNVDGKIEREMVKKFVPKGSYNVIPKVFDFRYVENPAAAFSLTRSIPEWFRRPFLIIFSTIAMLGMAIWYFMIRRPDGLVQTAVALICGGAMGNLVDRVRLGYVIDFLDFYAGWIDRGRWTYPTFNIADACIVIGAALIIFRTFFPLSEGLVSEEESH
jgi:signal peptidase II